MDHALHFAPESYRVTSVKPFLFLCAGFACMTPLALAQQPSPTPETAPKKPIPQPPPKLDAKSVPEVKDWIRDIRNGVMQRAHDAYKQGPDALEKLAKQLQTTELKDEDGRYTTPYFLRAIAGSRAPKTDEFWGDYQKRLFAEWRKRYPESKAAMLAEARMHLQISKAISSGSVPVEVTRKWEIVQEHITQAKDLLNGCRELQSKDPAWAVTYLALLDDIEVDPAEYEREALKTFQDFPDSGYAIASAVWGLRKGTLRADPGWEIWLRKQLATLPPEAAAKTYALTFGELVEYQGFYDAGLNGRVIAFDRELLAKGLDLLLKQYPDSPAIAALNAGLSAHVLLDRKRTQAALKRVNGKLDVVQLSNYWYKEALDFMTSLDWKPEVIGIPPITRRISITSPEFEARMEKAAAEGPRAMEELIQQLRSQDPIDKDGHHQSVKFFAWFGETFNDLKGYQRAERQRKLLEAWKKEFPDSPFARLAAAHHGIDQAWDARSSNYAAKVDKSQWEEFARRIEIVGKDLEACRELQQTEPAWSIAASTYSLATGDGRMFTEVSEELFRHFPECDSFLNASESHFMPRWGGAPGSWEPWLRQMLKDQPDDVRKAAYARGVMTFMGYIQYREDNKKEMLGNAKIDPQIMKDGMRLLREKYPDSPRIASMEAMWACYLTDDYETGYQAMKRMNGTLDSGVWHRYELYDRAVRWVTWKKSSEK